MFIINSGGQEAHVEENGEVPSPQARSALSGGTVLDSRRAPPTQIGGVQSSLKICLFMHIYSSSKCCKIQQKICSLPSGAGFKSQIYVRRIFLTMWSNNVPTMTVAAIGMNLFRRKDCDMTLFVVVH